MFVATLFIIAKGGSKQNVHPHSFEWTNKMWHFHIMECYPVKSTDTCSNMDEP